MTAEREARVGGVGLEPQEFVRRFGLETKGDPLFVDGVSQLELVAGRFERARRALLATAPGRRVVDLGASPGYGAYFFRDFEYAAAGLPDRAFAERLSSIGVPYLPVDLNDVQASSLDLAAFDAMVFMEVMEHLRRPFAFLRALHAATRPGQVIYVTTNNLSYSGYILKLMVGREIFDPVRTEEDAYPGHFHYYSLAGLAAAFREAGFDVRSQSHFAFTPPARLYRRKLLGAAKAVLGAALPARYASHIEIVAQR